MASMMRFRWNKPCAADGCWLASPRNAAERGMVLRGYPRQGSRGDLPGPVPGARQCTSQRWGDDSPHQRLLITVRPGLRVVSAGPGGRPQPAGGDVRDGSGCRQPLRVTAIGMGRGHVDADGVDMLDDHLSGHELLDRLVAAAIPRGRNQSVGHGRHFIPDVTGSGRVFDPPSLSASASRQPYEVVGPEEHLEPGAASPTPRRVWS